MTNFVKNVFSLFALVDWGCWFAIRGCRT